MRSPCRWGWAHGDVGREGEGGGERGGGEGVMRGWGMYMKLSNVLEESLTLQLPQRPLLGEPGILLPCTGLHVRDHLLYIRNQRAPSSTHGIIMSQTHERTTAAT